MTKHPPRHKEAIRPDGPPSSSAVPVVPDAPAAVGDDKATESTHWAYSVLLVVWMAGFFGLFIQLIIEFVIGLFRH
jgi:hypothetical protein